MNENIISNKEYNFPYRETYSVYTSDVAGYLDEIKEFFTDILEFYYIKRETYNSCLIDFYADTENDSPCFCIGQINQTNSGSNIFTLGIIPCLSGNTPYKNTAGEYQINQYMYIYSAANCIVFGPPSTAKDNKPIVQYVKFQDGRKIIFFKNKKISNNSDIYFGVHGTLYFTDIKYNENNISEKKQWILFSDAPNTSYIPEINKTASTSQGNPVHQTYYHYLNPRYMISCGGYIPDMAVGKDFLLKLSHFYIGDEYYLNEISFFSKLKDIDVGIPVGSIVKIENKDYIILTNLPYLNLGWRTTQNITDNRTNPWSISLIVPVNLEE